MGDLRISGLASGMDTDLMVQSLMKVERLKVDRYEQAKQLALWKQEAYNDMNRLFANFILNTRKDMGLTKVGITGIATGISYTRLDYVRKVSATDESKAAVSATSEAVNGSFTLDIQELAKGASLTSEKVSQGDTFGTYMELDLGNGGEKIVVSNENGVNMKDIAKAINNANQGISASFEVDSYGKGALILQTAETGENAKINLQVSNVVSGEGDLDFINQFENTSVQGKDAKVLFNGVEMNYNSNNIKLNGVNIQLKDIGQVDIKVETNVEGIMDKIKKLVDDYNELVEKVSGAVSEKKYSGYHPLSMEEKNSMHENDVKLWEEKSRSGLLNRDESLQRMLQNIRNDLYKTVEGLGGKFNHITQLGITTEKYARGATGGKLEIDEEKLRNAILEDPEGVMELLFKEEDKDVKDSKGIFTGVYDNIIDGMKSIIDKSGPGQDADLLRNVKSNILIDFVTKKSSISDIDREVLNTNKRIDDLNAALLRKENAYYAKFANMEQMLQQMYSQSNWLSQQLMR
ncbi:MAG: flagellar filament capping protein FliD [Tissierellaceae bacterium]